MYGEPIVSVDDKSSARRFFEESRGLSVYFTIALSIERTVVSQSEQEICPFKTKLGVQSTVIVNETVGSDSERTYFSKSPGLFIGFLQDCFLGLSTKFSLLLRSLEEQAFFSLLLPEI